MKGIKTLEGGIPWQVPEAEKYEETPSETPKIKRTMDYALYVIKRFYQEGVLKDYVRDGEFKAHEFMDQFLRDIMTEDEVVGVEPSEIWRLALERWLEEHAQRLISELPEVELDFETTQTP